MGFVSDNGKSTNKDVDKGLSEHSDQPKCTADTKYEGSEGDNIHILGANTSCYSEIKNAHDEIQIVSVDEHENSIKNAENVINVESNGKKLGFTAKKKDILNENICNTSPSVGGVKTAVCITNANTFDCTENSNTSALYKKYIYEGTELSRFNSELETSVFHSSGIYSIDDTDSFVQPASIFPDKNKILHGIESYNKCSTSGNKENEIFAGSEAYTESDIDMSDYSSHLDSSSSSTPLCIVDPYDPYSVQEPLEQTGYSNKTTLNLPSNKQRKTALDYLFEIVQTELFIIEKGAVNKTRHSDFGTRRYNVVSKSRQFKNDINGGMRRNSDFKVEDDNGVKKKRGRKRKIYTQDKLEPGDFLTYKDENNEEKRFPLEIVNGRKIYFCPFERCNRNFPSKSRIKRHFVVHTDDKPYKCLNPYCQKAFSRKDNMIQHYKSHCIGRKKGPSLIN